MASKSMKHLRRRKDRLAGEQQGEPLVYRELLEGFCADVYERLLREMRHPMGAAGRTARFVILARDLLAHRAAITCVVHGCDRIAFSSGFPCMCEEHLDELLHSRERDEYLAALLVAGWPLPPVIEAEEEEEDDTKPVDCCCGRRLARGEIHQCAHERQPVVAQICVPCRSRRA